MAKIISANEAAKLVKDGDMIATSGFVGNCHPEAVSAALERRFLAEGAPRNLQLTNCAGQGDGKDRGLNHFGHEGMSGGSSAGIGTWPLSSENSLWRIKLKLTIFHRERSDNCSEL